MVQGPGFKSHHYQRKDETVSLQKLDMKVRAVHISWKHVTRAF